MPVKFVEFPLSDDAMRVQLERGGEFRLKSGNWQAVERQVDRLGFGDRYYVTQVCTRTAKLTKVTPVGELQERTVRQAA